MGGQLFGMSVSEALAKYKNLKRDAINRYREGESIGEVADALRVSHQTVYLWLLEAGLKVRDKKQAAALRMMKRLLKQNLATTQQ